MEVLDSFLEFLKDGKWHDLTEMSEKLGITGVKIGIVAGFFKHYGFIETDGIKARIDERVRDFLKEMNK